MRSTFFKSPLEFSLNIDGEQWKQGQKITGELNIKNHSSEAISLDCARISLALGNFKKVKTKDPKAFENLNEIRFEESKVNANDEVNLKWSYQLNDNAPVTEKKQSLYAIFGNDEDPWSCGHIQLYIHSHPIIEEYLKTFETFFRFKVKEFKNKKGQLEAVMTPPSVTKEFSSLDSFSCLFDYSEEELKIDYNYKIKVLSADVTGAKVDKKSKKISQTIASKDYLLSPGMVDSQKIKSFIEEILEQVKTKKIF